MNLTRKIILIAVVILLVFTSAVSASGQKEPGSENTIDFISIGTASPAGAYYPLGVAMADLWNHNIDGIRFSSQETGGSVANMNFLNNGELELGMSNENVAYNAFTGIEPFKNAQDVMGGWILNNSNAVIVSLGRSGLTSVADLRGKKVALGAPGSSANVFGELILASEGIGQGDYEAVYMGWQESADALNDGFVDAALMVGGQPFPAITSLSVRTSVQVLTFNTEKFRKLSTYPYAVDKIPAKMYEMKQDGDSVVIRSVVYIRPDLSEEIVYQIMKVVFGNIPALVAAHPSASGTRIYSEEAASKTGLIIHAGAIRYAKEVGEW